MKTRFLFILGFIVSSSAFIPSVHAQGAAFTYQGRLNDGANPASGSYDLRLELYDTATLAGTVTGAQLAAGAVGAANIASNSITAAQLAPGAALTNLAASGQAGVPSSGLVLSATDYNLTLINAGYVKLGTIQGGDTWQERPTAPAARNRHTAVWTGSEMLVWGGLIATVFNDTWSYTPGKVMFLYQKP